MSAEVEKQQKHVPKRNLPGSKRSDWYSFAPSSLEDMDSSFSIQQYLQYLNSQTQTAEQVDKFVNPPDATDEALWQYENMRMLCLQLNNLIVALQDVCHPENGSPGCVEMKADEWLYLCASHPSPQNCCAIDYIVHSLDGASALLNSTKFFSSRVSVPDSSVKQFALIARRLYRIFAHAYYHHRDVFDAFEDRTRLYERVVKLSLKYDLIPPKLFIIKGYGFEGEVESMQSQQQSSTSSDSSS
ncbi:hypothetical protein MIR68_003420 [Amoeboaphelidium protococcarum]|nr:hypothetical protein MIR68_003420 [Amoeboaphelidium protococcarum]